MYTVGSVSEQVGTVEKLHGGKTASLQRQSLATTYLVKVELR